MHLKKHTEKQTKHSKKITEKSTEKINKSKKKNAEKTTIEATTEKQKNKTPKQKITEQSKGGDTSLLLQNCSVGPDGKSYYKVFKPAVYKFDPLKKMSLGERFNTFEYNGQTYTCKYDGEITEADYEPELLEKTMCSYWEDRPIKSEYNVEIKGWEYRAGVEIYKLKNINPEEAVAAQIFFLNEIKLYKFITEA